MDTVILSSKKINSYELISNYEGNNCDLTISGGQSIFIGYMRKTNSCRNDITSMILEFYPKMTQKYLENLCNKVKHDFCIDNILIAHRVGEVFPEDCLVIIACWSKHRKECTQAVKIILEDLKHNAPLWKKEFYSNQDSNWVEKNT